MSPISSLQFKLENGCAVTITHTEPGSRRVTLWHGDAEIAWVKQVDGAMPLEYFAEWTKEALIPREKRADNHA